MVKYSSEIYGNQGLFLEKNKYNYFFDRGVYFKVEKIFLYKKLFYKKKNYIKNF